MGSLESWWRGRPEQPRPWGEASPGHALREYYWELAIELRRLKRQFEKGTGDEEAAPRITELERVFADDDTDGVSGDSWLDDWDGKEAKEEEKPTPRVRPESKPDPDALEPDEAISDDEEWQNVSYGA